MKHDKDESDTQASTTMISTSGKAEEEPELDQAPELKAANDSGDDMAVDDEDSAQRLDSFDKFSKSFVRALNLTLEDVGVGDRHRQKYLEVLD